MVGIKLICVGTIKEKFHRDEINEFLKRLQRFAKVEIIEVDEEKIKDKASPKDEANVLIKEGQRLLSKIKDSEYVFLLDLHGKEISSEDFASKMNSILNEGYSTIDFVIGGSFGLSDDLRKRANFALKISPMTFTHQMTRIITLEQIYRSFKINANETYHK